MKFSFICDQSHEPEIFRVEAENEEQALDKIMEKYAPHTVIKHPEMTNAPSQQISNLVLAKLKIES